MGTRPLSHVLILLTLVLFPSTRSIAALPSELSNSSLEFLAGQGNVEAMNLLGYRLISDGEDAARGLSWLERAAEEGDVKAASNIGWLLMQGEQLPRDYVKAAYWLGKAAEGNLTVAQSLLGDLYRDGLGVAQDSLKADSLYRTAYERGFADAGYKLAHLNRSRYAILSPSEAIKEGKYFYYGMVPSEGVKLFYQAADAGDAEAMALLGDAYTRAVGVPYDHDLSLKYYMKAALGGNNAAQFILAELLEIFPDALRSLDQEIISGIIDPDLMRSPLYWYEQAAEGGITSAEEAAASLR